MFQFLYGHETVQGFSAAGNHVVHLKLFGLGTFANLQTYMSQVGNDADQLRRRPLLILQNGSKRSTRTTSTWPERTPLGDRARQ